MTRLALLGSDCKAVLVEAGHGIIEASDETCRLLVSLPRKHASTFDKGIEPELRAYSQRKRLKLSVFQRGDASFLQNPKAKDSQPGLGYP